ncbi:Transposable element Hobo transposase [Frankliniella fusca]|uniref:Transposable element Hobo transposase n=1 Tax=Frankliniella fusca TaxID=407009 RepID=A0AAE1HEF8_9NEOP|nr:Transposable element Hobo transposase [Frankliniella fusca]KAK3919583.1 Transposable element Hobo transposase [Frankliniella fusca]
MAGNEKDKKGVTKRERQDQLKEVKEKVENGDFKLIPQARNCHAKCWRTFELVVKAGDGEEEENTGYVHCRTCDEYVKWTGTSALNRHVCQLAEVKDLELLSAPSPAKEAVLDATAECVAVDLRPLSLMQGPGFLNLAQTLVLTGHQFGKVDVKTLFSDSKTIKRRINDLAEDERAELYPRVAAAAAAGEMSCSVDMWAEDSRKQNLMGCNVHFPSLNAETNEWEVETKSYFTERFPTGHAKTAENLRAFIVQNFEKRGISEETLKKICFVTDGEQAQKNALNGFWREYCLAHAYNIVYTHSMTVAPKNFQKLTPEALFITEQVDVVVKELRKMKTSVKNKVILDSQKLAFPKLFNTSNCVAFVCGSYEKIRRILTLSKAEVALRALEEMNTGKLAELAQYLKDLESAVGRVGHTHGSALPEVLSLCELREADSDFMKGLRILLSQNECISVLRVLKIKDACSDLVHYFKSSGLMEELPTSLKQYMEVRWSSCYRMLDSIRKVYPEVRAVLERKGQTKRLDEIPLEFLTEIVNFLEPLKLETERVQAKNCVTASLPLVSYHTLRQAYSPDEADSEPIRIMRARLYRELENVVQLTDTHKIAAFLDPSFRSFRNILSETEKSEVHGMVRRLINESDSDPQQADELQAAPTPPPPKKTKFDPYAAFRESAESLGDPVEDEVEAYLREPLGIDFDHTKQLSWWMRRADRFPRLSKLARRYLCVPATSAETERTFSDAGWILNKRRKNLEMGVVDDLITLHMNCRNKIRERTTRLKRKQGKRPAKAVQVQV